MVKPSPMNKIRSEGRFLGVKTKVPDSGFKVNTFELQSNCYINFWTGEYNEPLFMSQKVSQTFINMTLA